MNYLLSVDWLEFTANPTTYVDMDISQSIYKITEVLFLKKIENHTRRFPFTYSTGFEIILEGEIVGTVFSKVMNDNLTLRFRIDNFVFYGKELKNVLQSIKDGFHLGDIHINRLDISFDTDTDLLERFKSLYYDNGISFRYRNKIKVNGTGHDDFTTTIGSLKSQRLSGKIYDKSRELSASQNKEYQSTLFNKVFEYKHIYRFEISLCDKILKEYPLDINQLHYIPYLEGVFNKFYKQLIRFKNSDGVDVGFISVNGKGIVLEKKQKPVNRGSNIRIKGVVNFLESEELFCKSPRDKKKIEDVRTMILKKYGLVNWDKMKKIRSKKGLSDCSLYI